MKRFILELLATSFTYNLKETGDDGLILFLKVDALDHKNIWDEFASQVSKGSVDAILEECLEIF